MIAAIKRQPPSNRWKTAGFVVCLAAGIVLERNHLPGWGLLIFAATILAASLDEPD